MKNIIILNFSGRKSGNCASVADVLKELHNGTNVRDVRVSDKFHPCTDCDYECLRIGGKCPALDPEVEAIMQSVCDSDIVYYVIPNYCGVPCANYYAFNERSVGWFGGDREKMKRYMSAEKRFVFITNTMSEAFKDVVRQQCSGNAEVLQLASRKYSKHSIDGDILDSKEAFDELERFVSTGNV